MIQTDIATFVENLLATMTLAEKIGQLVMVRPVFAEGSDEIIAKEQHAEIRDGHIGSMLDIWGAQRIKGVQTIALSESRLKIPLLFAYDVLHGYETIFPVPLAEAAAFDPALWKETARIAAVETAAEGVALTFAPMLDVARDPRWGRIVESPGEDPWLASRFAAAKVEGFQQANLAQAPAIAATAKHLGAYGAVRAGREYASVDVSDRALHEIHFPAFKAAVEAGVAAIMPAFVDVAGVPMTANHIILQNVVRERWGFDGVMISDFAAVGELISHGVAGDLAEAAALALRAGIDIDMASEAYPKGLVQALERGLVTVDQIDAAVRRVLRLKAKLGLFDDPHRTHSVSLNTTVHRELARDAAARSIVLLQNRDQLLPLSPAPAKLAMIGPFAAASEHMLGPWAAMGRFDGVVDFVTGLQAALPNSQILHVAGGTVESATPSDIEEAVRLVNEADMTVLCLGEAPYMCGEAGSRVDPGIPQSQRQLAEAVFATGKPVIVTLTCGRPLVAPWLFDIAGTVLATWFLGSEAGHALADVLTEKCVPGGKLSISWPAHTGQIPIFFAQNATGRPANSVDRLTSKYLDAPVEPQFPFGHGLSYSRFSYGNLRVSPETVSVGDVITVTVDITNEGPHAAEETAFLFIRDMVASVARPVLELRGMGKAKLAAGECSSLTFHIATADLAFPGNDWEPCLEEGAYQIFVGASADHAVLLKTSISLAMPTLPLSHEVTP